MKEDLVYHIDDKEIWRGVKEGDKKSFNKLFRAYYSQLYIYGLKILPNHELVKECVQEVYIRIWETREKLGEVNNVRAYLMVSVRREILSAKEKKRHLWEKEQLDDDSFQFEMNEFEKNENVSGEVSRYLLKSINSLPKKQREIIMLFFYHELSYKEISRIMGISIQAVRNLMYRTLTHLRKSIGKDDLDKLGNVFFEFFSILSVKKV